MDDKQVQGPLAKISKSDLNKIYKSAINVEGDSKANTNIGSLDYISDTKHRLELNQGIVRFKQQSSMMQELDKSIDKVDEVERKEVVPELKTHTTLLNSILEALSNISTVDQTIGQSMEIDPSSPDKKTKGRKTPKSAMTKGRLGSVLSKGMELAPALLARTGLVAGAGAAGWAVGSYINDEYISGTELSDQIGSSINSALNLIGLGIEDNTKAMFNADLNRTEQLKKANMLSKQYNNTQQDLVEDSNTLLKNILTVLSFDKKSETDLSEVPSNSLTYGPSIPMSQANDQYKLSKSGEVAMIANSNTKAGSMIDFIGKADGGANGYDSFNGNTLPKNKRISEMTVGEVIEYQKAVMADPSRKKNQSTAAGKSQIMLENMEAHVAAGRVKLTDKFDAETQDRLAIWHATDKNKARRAAVDKFAKDRAAYREGKLSEQEYKASRDVLANSWAKEWAALPSPENGGRSYYDKKGGNHSTVSLDQFYEALDTLDLPSSTDQSINKTDKSKLSDNSVNGSAISSGKDDEIDESVKDLRIKMSDGSIKTIRETGAKTYGELTNKGGQAFAGGNNDADTVYATSLIQQKLGSNFGRVTAVNDAWHAANKPTSKHTRGTKSDFSINNMSLQQGRDESVKALSEKGLVEGVDYKITAEDKAMLSKTGGTAPHIDFELTQSGKEKISSIRSKGSVSTITDNNSSSESDVSINTSSQTAAELESSTNPIDESEKQILFRNWNNQRMESTTSGNQSKSVNDIVSSDTGQDVKVRYSEHSIDQLFSTYFSQSLG
jgi:hypothetical protein